ncbi:hypothetical protein [Flavihumibacter petaseus]|uniref:Uncharacterized protein n=1 Tax=Flavihumibacter petaseus NBRC 106054 TaxID=1220578 RepID=A0A0E9MZL7_9BACT|nr:hypothetical protein [Flavihumibacter petaseus]GAO42560.1 hypothetical protein FPE01S_01_15750 [Flavihumibacter petaseus NBRC 106054]
MKRVFAIFLLTAFLFNLVGYNLVFNYLIEKADWHFAQARDNQLFDESDLTELKVALNLPYYTDQPEFETVEGEIVINDIHYSYVKKRISNDTLYLKCKPNAQKSRLVKDKTRFVNTANDLPAGKKQHDTSKKGGFGFEYNESHSLQVTQPVILPDQLHFALLSELPCNGYSLQLLHPPAVG